MDSTPQAQGPDSVNWAKNSTQGSGLAHVTAYRFDEHSQIPRQDLGKGSLMRRANKIAGALKSRILRQSLALACMCCCIVLSGCVVYVRRPAAVVVTRQPVVVVGQAQVGQAQVEPQPQAQAAPAAVEVTPAVQQLEPLVAPVALYPDPLLAVVLPASTYPEAIQDASKWVAANPAPPDASIDAQAWPTEVKSPAVPLSGRL